MNVVGISGSARRDGNTALLIKIIFKELNKNGIDTELIQLFDKEILSCKACFACKKTSRCAIQNDDFNYCFEKMLNADGIILGSPVYSADISSKMKAFLERAGVIISCNPHLLKCKVGVSIAAVRRGGGLTAVDTMNHFLLNKEVIIVGSTYWNMVYGKDVGEVLSDDEGIANMKNIGENMSWLLEKIRDK
ncbi:MAG: flavodoxin family protein [Lachnospiraceae bacterium]|nr:flavodoxin family protein [Lachnospiraceae bacterium]